MFQLYYLHLGQVAIGYNRIDHVFLKLASRCHAFSDEFMLMTIQSAAFLTNAKSILEYNHSISSPIEHRVLCGLAISGPKRDPMPRAKIWFECRSVHNRHVPRVNRNVIAFYTSLPNSLYHALSASLMI
jgi:hypothetical protein